MASITLGYSMVTLKARLVLNGSRPSSHTRESGLKWGRAHEMPLDGLHALEIEANQSCDMDMSDPSDGFVADSPEEIDKR